MTSDFTRYLPHRPPFLFVDAIVAEGDNSLTTRFVARPDFDFFRGHYPGNPILPGVIISEAVFQAGSILLAKIQEREPSPEQQGVPVLTRIQDARFRSIVRPGDELSVEVRLKERMGRFFFMSGSVRCGDRRVMTVDFSVALAEAGAAS